jgi:uncharacterized protein YifE (UPF0438 family)
MGLTLRKPSAKHRSYLELPFEIQHGLKMFDADQIAVLNQYGSWFHALMTERISPETVGQEHFVLVCQGKATPENKYEHIWRTWMLYRDQDSERSSTSSSPFGQPLESAKTPRVDKPIPKRKRIVRRDLPKDGDPYRDALDHRARLPGSYGSGKRK